MFVIGEVAGWLLKGLASNIFMYIATQQDLTNTSQNG